MCDSIRSLPARRGLVYLRMQFGRRHHVHAQNSLGAAGQHRVRLSYTPPGQSLYYEESNQR